MDASEKQKALIGGAILIGAVAILYHLHKSGGPYTDPASGASVMPTPIDSPPVMTQGNPVVPGGDINLGGTPSYLSYNFPQSSYLPSNSHPISYDSGIPPQPNPLAVPVTIAGGNGASCGCDSNCQAQLTPGRLLQTYGNNFSGWVNNYDSVGLNSVGMAPTGY